MGRVLPPVIRVTVNHLPAVRWTEASINLVMNFTIRINDSIVDVECDLNDFQPGADISHPFTRALDLARAVIDSYGFGKGYGLTVYLDKVINPDGTESHIFPKMEHLAGYFTAFDIDSMGNTGPDSFDAMLRTVISEPALFMALNDLLVSITIPHHGPVSCGRAVEGLRVLMVPPGVDRRQGWSLMRENLNVSQKYLSFITDNAQPGRHGDRTHIRGPTVQEIIDRSWVLMNRFLEFRKRGNQRLPVAEFPLLIN